MHVGRIAQDVDDFEGTGHLPLDPVRVHRVHDRDRRVVGQVTHNGQELVEVAAHLQHPTAPCISACASLPSAMWQSGISTTQANPDHDA